MRQQWSRETVRAAADRLVEQKIEAGELRPPVAPDFNSGRADWLPSIRSVINHWGSLDNLKEAMGFLTPAVIDRWTDEEWEQNGQWFVDACRELDLPINRETTQQFSTARLIPSEPRIRDRYKNLPNYHRALGVNRSADHTDWDFDTHIENGKWFSQVLGAKTGMPVMPTTELSAAGSELGLVPKPFTTGKIFKSWERYQHYLGFVTHYTIDNVWDDEQWIQNGKWLADVFAPDNATNFWLSEGILEQASALHIGPKLGWIKDQYGSITDYNTVLGFKSPHAIRMRTDREILEQLEKKTQNNNGRFPTSTAYEQDHERDVNVRLLERRFGSYGRAAEALGHIISTQHWEEPEYLKNGLMIAIANMGKITPVIIRTMSRRQQSPSTGAINSFFEGKYPEYKEKVLCAYEQFRVREKDGLPARFAFGAVALTLTEEPSDEFSETCETFEGALDRIANDTNFQPLLRQIRNMDTVNMSNWDLVDFVEYIAFLKRRGIIYLVMVSKHCGIVAYSQPAS